MASLNSSKNGDSRSSDSMSKKQKNVEETLDHISQLPDEILVHILSLLPATLDAVATCVLSKRWRYLWTSIYNFLFPVTNSEKPENLKSFVDHVLTHSTCSKIKKFKVHFGYASECNFDLEINRWINFAVERKVEDLVLCNLEKELTYQLPLSIYTSSSLITLELCHWVFDKRLLIAWNSLKSLKLDLIRLDDDDDIVNLLSGCPALETLELRLFFGRLRRLEITSPNLKRLILHCGYSYYSWDIVAPHLQHLEINGDHTLQCSLINVSSLVTANLTFNVTCFTLVDDYAGVELDNCRDYHQNFKNLVLDYLQKLSHATELIIGRWFAEVVFILQMSNTKDANV